MAKWRVGKVMLCLVYSPKRKVYDTKKWPSSRQPPPEDLVAYAKQHGEPQQISGKQELYEAILNMYC